MVSKHPHCRRGGGGGGSCVFSLLVLLLLLFDVVDSIAWCTCTSQFSGSLLSAWRNKRTSPRAFATPALSWRARPFGAVITVAPACRAVRAVRSLLPPSTTIISHC